MTNVPQVTPYGFHVFQIEGRVNIGAIHDLMALLDVGVEFRRLDEDPQITQYFPRQAITSATIPGSIPVNSVYTSSFSRIPSVRSSVTFSSLFKGPITSTRNKIDPRGSLTTSLDGLNLNEHGADHEGQRFEVEDSSEARADRFPKFMSLPLEIRLIVYELAFAPYAPHRRKPPTDAQIKKTRCRYKCITHNTMELKSSISLLLVNRRIYAEAYEIFTTVNRFILFTMRRDMENLPCRLFRREGAYFLRKEITRAKAPTPDAVPGVVLYIDLDTPSQKTTSADRDWVVLVSWHQIKGLRRILECLASSYRFTLKADRRLRLSFHKPCHPLAPEKLPDAHKVSDAQKSLAAHELIVAPFRNLGYTDVRVESEFISKEETALMAQSISQTSFTTAQLLEKLSADLEDGLMRSSMEQRHSAGIVLENSLFIAWQYLDWWLHQFKAKTSKARVEYLDLIWRLSMAEAENALILLRHHYDRSHPEYDRSRARTLAKKIDDLLIWTNRLFDKYGYCLRSTGECTRCHFIQAVTFRLCAENMRCQAYTELANDLEVAAWHIHKALETAPNDSQYKQEAKRIQDIEQSRGLSRIRENLQPTEPTSVTNRQFIKGHQYYVYGYKAPNLTD